MTGCGGMSGQNPRYFQSSLCTTPGRSDFPKPNPNPTGLSIYLQNQPGRTEPHLCQELTELPQEFTFQQFLDAKSDVAFPHSAPCRVNLIRPVTQSTSILFVGKGSRDLYQYCRHTWDFYIQFACFKCRLRDFLYFPGFKKKKSVLPSL